MNFIDTSLVPPPPFLKFLCHLKKCLCDVCYTNLLGGKGKKQHKKSQK